MNDFENRERFPLEKAAEIANTNGTIKHILNNGDGTYSVMGHISCEQCDYCHESNEWWQKKKSEGLSYEEISKLKKVFTHVPKEDPYEWEKVRSPENYGLINSFNPENTITLLEVERYWEKVIPNIISLDSFKEELQRNGYVII